jgi:hypothetical protein
MPPLHLTRMSVIAALLIGLPGCATRGGLSALQTELRHREDQIGELDRELKEARKQLELAQKEESTLRSQLSRNVSDKLLPEQSDLIFRAQGVKFSEYLTSGVDRDGQPGDELVSVLLTPHDGSGDAIRLPGQLKIEVRDLNNPEGRQLIGSWVLDEQKMSEQWHTGFLSSGYHLELPLKNIPRHSEVTLHAQLTTPDGRQFSATQPISLRLPDGTENIAEKSRTTPPLRETSQRNAVRPNAVPEGESAEEDDPEVEQTGAELESRIDDEDPENPFDEEASPRIEARKPAARGGGGRRTETSDRFRSFDPPRYQ